MRKIKYDKNLMGIIIGCVATIITEIVSTMLFKKKNIYERCPRHENRNKLSTKLQ